MRDLDARDGQCASERYLFASIEAREEAKAGYLQTLVDARGPKPQPCPTGACMACGVASYNARRAAEAWHPVGGGKYVNQHLCAACEAQREEGAVIGRMFLERLVLNAADPTKELLHRRFETPRVDGAQFWIDTDRTKPNERPWQHLDLNALRKSIESGQW